MRDKITPTVLMIACLTTSRKRDVLEQLKRDELRDAADAFGLEVADRRVRDQLVDALARARRAPLAEILADFSRDRLKELCLALDLDEAGRSRPDFARRLLEAYGDDDNQGRRLEVLWELELGARVLQPRTHGLGDVARLDPPRHFAAYLNALRWNVVTATEARLFQAPFRAGIQLMSHQLPPLKRALELPRANLFIADDVGLGKTIEAGLILQELQLRQRVDFVLIVCPAAICLQWRDEMARRFGLHFELYNRAFVGRRRQERGFQVNPWDTHNRFVISYPTLRRPEYREPLLRHLGERTRKSLLVLDEAHTAAPATASKYAVDSRVTRVIRDVGGFSRGATGSVG